MAIEDSITGTAGPILDGRTESGRLRGNLGSMQLLFTMLAFNTPIAVVLGFMPIVVGYGNGIGAPVAYFGAVAIVALFAVGFTKMSRHIDNPGGFYAFVARGLGRELGLGASFLAVVCYYLMLLASYAFVGLTLNALVVTTFRGPDIPWWVYSLAVQLLVGVLGYFRLDISARVLLWLVAAEVLVVLAYDAAVLLQGGEAGITGGSFLPASIMSGSVGLGLLFAMLSLMGFEVAVVFRDEIRNPSRSIPRVTYIYLAVVGLFYGATAWVFIVALGESNAVAAAAADPTGAFLGTVQTYLGWVGVDLFSILVNTGLIAGVLAAHNVASRYAFNLGKDGILPSFLGRVHRSQGSPHAASVAISIAVLVGLAPFMILSGAPEILYAQFAGGAGYAFLMLLFLADIAVAVYLVKRRPEDTTVWHRLIGPLLAGIGLLITLYLATTNIELLISSDTSIVALFFGLLYGSVLIGIVTAFVLKRTRPATYARIGRQ